MYKPLDDKNSEILGLQYPTPSCSWWARSDTKTKLLVVVGAIATSIVVFGSGFSLGLKHHHDAGYSTHLLNRRHHKSHTQGTTLTNSIAWSTSIASAYGSSTTTTTDGQPAAATTYGVPSAAAISYASSYLASALPTSDSTTAYAASTRVVSSGSSTTAMKTTYGSSSVSTPSVPSTAVTSGTFWQPPVDSSWQIVLSNALDLATGATSVTPDVDIFDIDLFDNPAETFTALHALGKKAICYFSAGSYEPGRPDSGDFLASDKGSELQGWPGEYWLDLNSQNVRKIMAARIALAASKGCDGIDPDNVDGYGNANGLGLTQQDSIDYVTFLSQTAVSLGLSTGLKNAGEIIPSVIPYVHFSINEQCVEYSECATFAPFVTANKPVFHIEYPSQVPAASSVIAGFCDDTGSAAGATGFSTVLKNMNLDGSVQDCNGQTASTPLA